MPFIAVVPPKLAKKSCKAINPGVPCFQKARFAGKSEIKGGAPILLAARSPGFCEAATAMRMLLSLALAVTLGAGSAGALTANEPGNGPPPDLRAIIAANLQKPDPELGDPDDESGGGAIFPARRRVSEVELSDAARRTLTMRHGWAWQTCMRATVDGRRLTLAVFVAQNRVVEARTALVVDACEQAHYAALPVKRPVPKPSTKVKKAKKPEGESKEPKS